MRAALCIALCAILTGEVWALKVNRVTRVVAWSEDGSKMLVEEAWQACTDGGTIYRVIRADPPEQKSFALDPQGDAAACRANFAELRGALGGFAGVELQSPCDGDPKPAVTVDEVQRKRVEGFRATVDSPAWERGRIVVSWGGLQRLAVKRRAEWTFLAWAAASTRLVALFDADAGLVAAWALDGGRATEIGPPRP